MIVINSPSYFGFSFTRFTILAHCIESVTVTKQHKLMHSIYYI